MESRLPSLKLSSDGRVTGALDVAGWASQGRFTWTMTTRRVPSVESYVQVVTLHSENLKTTQKSLPLSAAISENRQPTPRWDGFKLLW